MSELMTAVDALAQRVQQDGNRPAMFQPLGEGEMKEYSWVDISDQAHRVATHLRSYGLPAGANVALISKNCVEWIIADLAIWLAGYVSVPLYPTLTAESVRQIMEHSESKVLFVGKLDDWDKMKPGVPDGVSCISFSLSPESARKEYIGLDQIIQDNEPLADPAQPGMDELATIVYTSGTTGMPKGVMQNFRAFAVVGQKSNEIYSLTRDDRLISYLPLSHVAERVLVEQGALYRGVQIYFAESLETFGEDLKRAKPTMFFAVPRIWSKFYQKASEALPPEKLNKLLKIPLLNRVIKKKVLSAMGLEECGVALSGAAALSPELINWFNKLGLEIMEVYGMSENLAWSHTTKQGDQKVGWVGTPNDEVECRLGDNDEILVRSPGNMLGYYKEKELTDEAFVDGDWLCTGDKGEIDAEGRLRITGRVKEIFKTEKGKYVSPAPIENKLVSHPGLELACVTGSGLSQPIALVSFTEEEKAKLTTEQARKECMQDLETMMQRVNGEVDAHERLDAVVVVSEEWTVDSGMITPTMKLKRSEIDKFYGPHYETWASRRGVVWAD